MAGLVEWARAEPDAARARLAAGIEPASPPAELEAWAQVAESLGQLETAVKLLQRVVQADATRVGAFRRLAALRLEQGELDRAARCLRRVLELEPGDRAAEAELSAIESASGGAPDEPLAIPGELSPPPAPRRPAVGVGDEGPTDGRFADVTDAEVMAFVLAFAGRDGVYARQWASNTGKGGYSPVHEPFTPGVARRHLRGEITVGVYPVRHDQTSRWLCLDFDLRADARRTARDREARRDLTRTVHAAALQVLDVIEAAGMHGLLEDSAGKGRHIWLFFEQPIPAPAVRKLGEVLVGRAGYLSRDVQVEVFPKQVRALAPDQLGNLVKLPLGVHRVSRRRSALLDREGRPLAEPMSRIAAHPRVPLTLVQGLVQAARAANPGAGSPRPAPGPDVALPATVPELAVPAYALERDAEFVHLQARCHVVGKLAERAQRLRVLSSDERQVLTYVVGHLTQGAEAMNAVLRPVLNVSGTDLLKRPLRGHPMSCPKIRSRVPEVAASVACDCVFDAAASYPHPLLHLGTLRASLARAQRPELASGLPASAAPAAPAVVGAGDVDATVTAWQRAQVERQSLERSIAELEQTLIGRLGLGRHVLPSGTVVIVERSGQLRVEEGR